MLETGEQEYGIGHPRSGYFTPTRQRGGNLEQNCPFVQKSYCRTERCTKESFL